MFSCFTEQIKPEHILGEDLLDNDEDSQQGEILHNQLEMSMKTSKISKPPFWLVPSDDDYQSSWMQRMVSSLCGDLVLFKTREGRAGKVHNFMLGLNLNNEIPLSSFTETLSPVEEEVDAVTGQSSLYPFYVSYLIYKILSILLKLVMFLDPFEFDRIYEPLDVKSRKIHVVDSGLTFNLPFPLILRPQRGVDLIISFDFSARPSDSSPPFKVIAHICTNVNTGHTHAWKTSF